MFFFNAGTDFISITPKEKVKLHQYLVENVSDKELYLSFSAKFLFYYFYFPPKKAFF